MNTDKLERLCCSPPDSAEIARKFAALSHPARIEILSQVASQGSCSCKDVVACLDLAQSTVSQHLRMLVDAGLLKHAMDGQRSRYEVDDGAMSELSGALSRFAETCCRAPTRD